MPRLDRPSVSAETQHPPPHHKEGGRGVNTKPETRNPPPRHTTPQWLNTPKPTGARRSNHTTGHGGKRRNAEPCPPRSTGLPGGRENQNVWVQGTMTMGGGRGKRGGGQHHTIYALAFCSSMWGCGETCLLRWTHHCERTCGAGVAKSPEA